MERLLNRSNTSSSIINSSSSSGTALLPMAPPSFNASGVVLVRSGRDPGTSHLAVVCWGPRAIVLQLSIGPGNYVPFNREMSQLLKVGLNAYPNGDFPGNQGDHSADILVADAFDAGQPVALDISIVGSCFHNVGWCFVPVVGILVVCTEVTL